LPPEVVFAEPEKPMGVALMDELSADVALAVL
jgi:hypothetical protein